MDTLFYIAVGVFLLSYIIIISEKVHRTVVALAGALLMVLLGVISQEQAIEGVDFNTLGVLIGMMVIVGIARHSGMFQSVAIWTTKIGKGRPLPIFFLLSMVTAVFSSLLDNVTTVLLIVPVIFVIANNLKISPRPYLYGAIIFSNIGGAATLIGDPPNIIIGSAAGLTFNDFLVHMGPIIVVLILITMILMYYKYRRQLVATEGAQNSIMKFDPMEAITDWSLMYKSIFVLGFVLFGFFTHSATHIEGATLALSGAAFLLLLTMRDPEGHLRDVEWTTIFFFIGLFVLVSGLEHVGVLQMLAEQMLALTRGNPLGTAFTILWSSAFFSSIIDNIPFVTAMVPLIQNIGEHSTLVLAPLWWALALGADIGGNATIVGASANVVVKGMAEQAGYKIGFGEYMKVALFFTFVALVMCSVYIWMRYY